MLTKLRSTGPTLESTTYWRIFLILVDLVHANLMFSVSTHFDTSIRILVLEKLKNNVKKINI